MILFTKLLAHFLHCMVYYDSLVFHRSCGIFTQVTMHAWWHVNITAMIDSLTVVDTHKILAVK